MTEALNVGYQEGDIKKLVRLGKYNDSTNRPMLVEFTDTKVKNLVMENVARLSHAQHKYSGIVIAHDMTAKEREQCRQLVEEAKKKQSEDQSGEYIYRVRGPPGQMKILKLKKR